MVSIEKDWAPHKAQRVQEIMHCLRKRIRDGEVGLGDELAFATKVRGGGGLESFLGKELRLKGLLDEALQSRWPEDGQNLLMFAAGQGRAGWFLRLVGEIRSRLGIRALVKELQEVDIEGAPLLFHAASCRREESCFQTVRDLITTVLDEGGLMRQVETVDVLGRNIIMHAARSNHLGTFEQVFAIRTKAEALMVAPPDKDDVAAAEATDPVARANATDPVARDNATDPVDAADAANTAMKVAAAAADAAAPEAIAAAGRLRFNSRGGEGNIGEVCEICLNPAKEVENAVMLRTMLAKRDRMGMNCLHHAADLGCEGVLGAVVDKCDKVDAIDGTIKSHLESDLESAPCTSTGAPVRKLFERCQDRTQSSFRERMNGPDERRRTPIMYVLRNNASRAGEKAGLKARFEMLRKRIPSEDTERDERWWMAPTVVRNHQNPKSEVRLVAELLHAARGGQASLELVLNTKITREDSSRSVVEVNLDDALAPEEQLENASWRRTEEAEIQGRAYLLGAASKLGDINVLELVVDAIKTGRFVLVKEVGGERFTLFKDHVATVDFTNEGEQGVEGGRRENEETKVEGDERRSANGRDEDEAKVADEEKTNGERWRQTREAKNEDEGVEAQEQEGARSQNTEIRDRVDERMRQAVRAISAAKYSVFSYAILSGRMDAVIYIHKLIVDLFPEKFGERWKILSGVNNRASSSLTCAASASMEADNHGRDIFREVLRILREEGNREQFRKLFSPKPDNDDETTISPLVGAVFSSNWVLFREVYDAVDERKEPWSREEFDELRQIPSGVPRRPALDPKTLHEYGDDIPGIVARLQWNLPPVMWREIEKGYKYIQAAQDTQGTVAGKHSTCSWRDGFKSYSGRAVTVAAERGGFASLRDLVKEGFPLHERDIPALLENLGDHEDEIVETVLFLVANASNPFVAGALLSRMLLMSEMDHPMHRKGLRRLQTIIDRFTIELLDDLPHTIRGMGVALLGGHHSGFDGHGLYQGKHHRLGNLAGFLVVQWMLEPSLLRLYTDGRDRQSTSETVDPLNQALDRGSRGLDLLNSPLALDYMSIKFSCTLPRWTSRDPFQPTVNEGFYKYGGFEKYHLSEILSLPARQAKGGNEHDGKDGGNTHDGKNGGKQDDGEKENEKENFMSADFLLRFLQGWDHADSGLKWNFPSSNKEKKEDVQRSIPHLTVLPGLQFSLAGILGRPDVFYQVPAIRFAFEILSYLVMLVLFCWSLLLKEHDTIPIPEAMFYVFAAGMVWREVLEFHDGMPGRRHESSTVWSFETNAEKNPRRDPRFNRMVSALARYVFHDTWNFLDTLTILCILVAFVYRIIALDDESSLFYAQFFLALSAPLLFSRLLVLSQIDSTLGPMTQVIWRMMSQTLRFSAFIAMVMLSFALAFFALFHTCDSDSSECGLNDAFGSFGSSFVTVFSSALDGPDFDIFDQAASDCGCDRPEAARLAGIGMMVVYMVVMALVLLNLFVAVLSTAHDEVYVNAEKEYHLARAKLIHQSARVVTSRTPPPPLNLIKLVFGMLLDTASEVPRLYLWVKGCETRPRDHGDAPGNASDDHCKLARELQPFTKTKRGKAFDDFFQRLAFALTMGAAAVVLSTILWTVSIPWVAWCLLRSVSDTVDPRKRDKPSGGDDGGGSFNENGQGGSANQVDGKKTDQMGCFLPLFFDHPGYFWRSLYILGNFVVLLSMILCAIILCLWYIIASCILWVLGVYMLLVKPLGSSSRYGMEEVVGPGKEGGVHWDRAWQLATLRNGGSHGHFHVGPFLKSKRGLDMHHLASLVKDRDAKSKFEEELVEIDRKLADTHIGLQHLASKAKVGGASAACESSDDDPDSEQLAEKLVVMADRWLAKRKEEKLTDAS